MSGCSGWNAVNPLCRAGEILGSAGKAVGNDIFGAIADYFAGVANSAVSWLWKQVSVATSIDLTATSIKTDLVATGSIAAIVTFALFLIQVIASTLRQDPGGLGRAVRGLGIAFIGAAFAIATTQLLLAAVDALCDAVVHFALRTDIHGMGSQLIVSSTLSSIGNPAGLLLISLVLIAAVVVVWVALMIRKMLIIVAAVFAPVAFSGAASDVSRSWVRRWIEFTLALVFSKLILVIIFMIGLSVLNDAGHTTASGSGKATQAITNLVVGALTLLLAGFAPWIAIKMVHFAGESFHAVHAQAATAPAGAQTMIAAPQKVASTAQRHRSVMSSNGSGPGMRSSGGPTSQPKSGSSGGPGSGAAAAAGPAAGVAPAAAAVPRAASAIAHRTGSVAEQARGRTDPPPSRGPGTAPSAS
jgi:type IV secretion system protein TrbL